MLELHSLLLVDLVQLGRNFCEPQALLDKGSGHEEACRNLLMAGALIVQGLEGPEHIQGM